MYFTFMQYQANFIPFYHRWGICMLISLFFMLCAMEFAKMLCICIFYPLCNSIHQNIFAFYTPLSMVYFQNVFVFFTVCAVVHVYLSKSSESWYQLFSPSVLWYLPKRICFFFTLVSLDPSKSFRLFLLYHSTQCKMFFKFENRKCSDVEVKCHKITQHKVKLS